MRAFPGNMPWSLWWFVATAAVYALQLSPWTGLVLMMVLAPFWSVVTINLGFLSLVAEVLIGRINPLWLMLPLMWFGGYTGAALMSHLSVAALDADARAHNVHEGAAFHSATQALVFDIKSPDLSPAPAHFVQNYRLPVAYGTDPYGKTAGHRASRILTDTRCQTIKADRSYAEVGVFISWFKAPDGKFLKEMCAVSMPEDPGLPKLFVTTRQEKHADRLAPFTLTRVTIDDAKGAVARLVTGHAQPLTWLPTPIMGCFLNSSRPSWDCFVGFQRDHVGIGGQGAYGGATLEAIAAALRLEKAHAGARRDEIAATPVPSLEAVVGERTDLSLATLDDVIANPRRRITVHDVKGLPERPALLQQRPPAMVEAMGRALANGRASYETARVLQHILANLPGADFDAIGPALLAVLAAQPILNDDTVAQTLASRLGRLGAPAVPVLERMTFSRPARPFAAAIFGLCRAGPDAVTLAERIASLAATAQGYDGDLDIAVYVALMRMGRSDIVERERAVGARFTKISRKVIERAITPASPPEVCVGPTGSPRVPA